MFQTHTHTHTLERRLGKSHFSQSDAFSILHFNSQPLSIKSFCWTQTRQLFHNCNEEANTIGFCKLGAQKHHTADNEPTHGKKEGVRRTSSTAASIPIEFWTTKNAVYIINQLNFERHTPPFPPRYAASTGFPGSKVKADCSMT